MAKTRLVRVELGALTRVEFSTIVRVPLRATPAQLETLVETMYEEIDGGEFQDDPHFWDKGECRYEAVSDDNEPEFEATDRECTAVTRLIPLPLPPPHAVTPGLPLTGELPERVDVVIAVDLNDLLHPLGVENLNEIADERILGPLGMLEDISYQVVGGLSNGSEYVGGQVLLRVQADVVKDDLCDEWASEAR